MNIEWSNIEIVVDGKPLGDVKSVRHTPAGKSVNWRWFSCYRTTGLFWFRLFGKGFSVKDTRKRALTFSQRMGKRCIKVGRYCVTYLPKEF